MGIKWFRKGFLTTFVRIGACAGPENGRVPGAKIRKAEGSVLLLTAPALLIASWFLHVITTYRKGLLWKYFGKGQRKDAHQIYYLRRIQVLRAEDRNQRI